MLCSEATLKLPKMLMVFMAILCLLTKVCGTCCPTPHHVIKNVLSPMTPQSTSCDTFCPQLCRSARAIKFRGSQGPRRYSGPSLDILPLVPPVASSFAVGGKGDEESGDGSSRGGVGWEVAGVDTVHHTHCILVGYRPPRRLLNKSAK